MATRRRSAYPPRTANEKLMTAIPDNLLEVAPAELPDAAASPPTLATYDEIRAVSRVPFVDQLWRVLAAVPGVLEPAWTWLAPLLGSVQAESAAGELRREALIPLALGLPAHKAFRGDMSRAEIGYDDRERISNFTMAAHYALPKLLLATALLDGANAASESGSAAMPALEPLPRGVAAGMPRVEPLDPAHARGQIVDLFAEIRARHGYAAIADYYRTIARAGDFLRVAWNPLRPIVGDPEYVERAARVANRAVEVAAALCASAGPGSAPVHIIDDRDLRGVVRFYLRRLLPEALVEVTIIKGLTDGPDTAVENSYSLADGVAPV
jgi:hypothetical protein